MTISPDQYELAVLEKIRLEFASADFRVEGTEDGKKHYIRGRYSLVPRQADVAVYRTDVQSPFFFADAKRHSEKLDVKEVESFIGMMDDVGAQIGLLVAPEGFSDGAARRAAPFSTRVRVMTIEQALTFQWLRLARAIYPHDWVFHETLAIALRLVDEKADPDRIITALEPIAFEEWCALIDHLLKEKSLQGIALLRTIARSHQDDGWRYNAIQRLVDIEAMSPEDERTIREQESDPEILSLLIR